jgi:hypothetical protein
VYGRAICLDADEVVKDPNAARIHVVEEPVMRPCEGTSTESGVSSGASEREARSSTISKKRDAASG